MKRLFVFAIGGTGSRVLKSLTMLLACGVKPVTNDDYEIVPIIIDPHKGNLDLKRTISLMDNYQAITNSAGLDNGFFSTKLITLDKLLNDNATTVGSYTFNLDQVGGNKFKEYIGFNELDIERDVIDNKPNKALSELLFSGYSTNKRGDKVNLLDVEMDIGFVGNPNIGSVVLNQFKESEEFKQFASAFNEDDRIFIISSIFGGTGAAGFPIVLKNIRGAKSNPELDSKGYLTNAKIGAVTVMPYFNLEKSEKSAIQKSDFISKTKSALNYYKNNVTSSVNSMYYICDNLNGKLYENDPGDRGQKNDAHFVEFASALAILDFLETPDSLLKTTDGVVNTPINKEFGIKEDTNNISFTQFDSETQNRVSLKLSQLFFFKKYIDSELKSSIENQSWSNDAPQIHKAFLAQTFYRNHLSYFLDDFEEWLKEMADNKRGFSPFRFNTDLAASINNYEAKGGWLSKKLNYTLFEDTLNKASKKGNYSGENEKFLKLFEEATKELIQSKFIFA